MQASWHAKRGCGGERREAPADVPSHQHCTYSDLLRCTGAITAAAACWCMQKHRKLIQASQAQLEAAVALAAQDNNQASHLAFSRFLPSLHYGALSELACAALHCASVTPGGEVAGPVQSKLCPLVLVSFTPLRPILPALRAVHQLYVYCTSSRTIWTRPA